jgi:hypothetical protein
VSTFTAVDVFEVEHCCTCGVATNFGRLMKKYFVNQCYEKSKKIDGTMVWEVGEEQSRNRICLCYSEKDARKIATALEQPLPPNPPTRRPNNVRTK